MAELPIITPETSSCVAQADRVAFIVDAAAYFAALASSLARARQSILILAWDIDSRTRLFHDRRRRRHPNTLASFMDSVLARRENLQAHVLCWSANAVYSFERESLLAVKMGWMTHSRLHFRMDGNHPLGASLHEKLVVVDDRVAFLGGMDLAIRRWDTPEHRADDERRTSPNGDSYGPFHDVQALVSGEVASMLGDVARERWRRATGETLSRPTVATDCWPRGVRADVRDVPVGIVRTDPAFQGRSEVRETQAFYLRAIAAARKSIFIENQYFGSLAVGDALVARLEEEAPPEIIVVTPKENSGWMEQATMGVLRARLVKRLREADRHDRVRVVCPVVAGGAAPNVHSKLLVVDDRLAFVGSANLSNRSLGVDTEVGVAIEADGRPDVEAAVAGLRTRLLAEHLGVTGGRFAEEVAARGSLTAAIDALAGSPRTLEPLSIDAFGGWIDNLAPLAAVADPEQPISFSKVTGGLAWTEPGTQEG